MIKCDVMYYTDLIKNDSTKKKKSSKHANDMVLKAFPFITNTVILDMFH